MIRPLWPDFEYHEHQLHGIEWMLEREQIGVQCGGVTVFGGLQCDDMGLGKTIQMTGTMKNNPKKRTLLLAPLAMLETWQDVMIKANFNVFTLDNKAWTRPTNLKPKRSCVYITNYEKLLHSQSLLCGEGVEWDRVVLDESQKIRTPGGAIAAASRKIVAPIRWAMSGTPLVNSMRDVVSQLSFLGVPCNKSWSWDASFVALMPQILIHRSLDSLRTVLVTAPPPPIIEEMILPFASEAESAFYRLIQGDINAHFLHRYRHDILTTQEKLKMIVRLRQISVHPQVYIKAKRKESAEYERADWTGPATKLVALTEIIRSESGHKYLVFCQFHDEMDIIQKHLISENVISKDSIISYHGGMTHAQRSSALSAAKDESCKVLLIQLQSGGVGLNLQEFDRCIFMSPWWTSALMDQAIARAVRMGQKRVVRVIHLKLAEEKTMNIDRLISGKADLKKDALVRLFHMAM